VFPVWGFAVELWCSRLHIEVLLVFSSREALAHSRVSFHSCHATVILMLCGWCDAMIAVNVWILVWTGVGNCCRKTVARPADLAQASQSR